MNESSEAETVNSSPPMNPTNSTLQLNISSSPKWRRLCFEPHARAQTNEQHRPPLLMRAKNFRDANNIQNIMNLDDLETSDILGAVESPKDDEEDRTQRMLLYGKKVAAENVLDDRPESPKKKFETGVINGDCLLACFTILLECFSKGSISSALAQTHKIEKAAASMRKTLVSYIKENWFNAPKLNPYMMTHEMITMTHDVEEERNADQESWGKTPEEQLQAYSKACQQIYFSDVEMLMFACMMHEKGTSIVFRTWRWIPEKKSSVFLSMTPDVSFYKMHNVDFVYVVDLEHSGNQTSAHYKLIHGGSLLGLLHFDNNNNKSASHLSSSNKNKKRRLLIRTVDL